MKSISGTGVAEATRNTISISSVNVVLSILECTLFSAIQFGWSSLVFVYKSIGLYRNLCPRNGTMEISQTCTEQEKRLNMFFSVSLTSFVFLGIIIGLLHKKLGTTRARVIFICIYPCGLVLLSYTNSDIPWMFFPGLTLVGLSGQALIVTDMHVVFHIKKGQAFYVTLLNGAVDSSSIAMLIVKILYEKGVEMKYTFWGIAVVQVVVTLTNTFLHWKQPQILPERTEANQTEREDNDDDARKNNFKTNETEPSFRQSVLTVGFGLYSIWIFFLCLRWVSYIGLANRRFSVVLKTTDKVSEFTDVLSYFMFGGLPISIITGGFLEFIKKRFEGSSDVYKRRVYPLIIALSICCAMSIVISTLGIVQSANTFYAEFAVVPFFRSLLYSTNMYYVVTMFHSKWISTIMVLSYATTGFSTIAQYFIFEWVVEYNAFQEMNYMMVGTSVVSFALPCMLLLNKGRGVTNDISQD
ncbi:equilibrative nucleobase transporter 1-like [Ostrea edulis]|uniref:equilibrative nucleobase transporter 1-like n=1 Tax=Ostrea edulis TaxID=37623 RepID=UPI0024AF6201|nr:equilibrative nucleobase transporter 1-like [Ostrea edulis]